MGVQNSNTSYVIINLKSTFFKNSSNYNSNTSYVIINLAYAVTNYKAQGNSNTSYVIINLCSSDEKGSKNKIQIHLMLLLIKKDKFCYKENA